MNWQEIVALGVAVAALAWLVFRGFRPRREARCGSCGRKAMPPEASRAERPAN